jgi:hypothetical protein
MVADNFAYPRDSDLLRKFSGNLRIILCGTDFGVNTDYLNLARKYDFTVYTIHKDLYDLIKLDEGESIEIEDNYYKIQNGKFVRYSSI